MNIDTPRSQLQSVLKSVLDKNVSDLVQMDDINEAMIVHNLRKRFNNDEIYVRTRVFSFHTTLIQSFHADKYRHYFDQRQSLQGTLVLFCPISQIFRSDPPHNSCFLFTRLK